MFPTLNNKEEWYESFIIMLGDLSDSPDSLRFHLAYACERIMDNREAEGKPALFSPIVGRWKVYLDTATTEKEEG